MAESCHCGQPLHYLDPALQALVEQMIAELGATVAVMGQGGWYAVPRHYIALHGLDGMRLHTLGFPTTTAPPIAPLGGKHP